MKVGRFGLGFKSVLHMTGKSQWVLMCMYHQNSQDISAMVFHSIRFPASLLIFQIFKVIVSCNGVFLRYCEHSNKKLPVITVIDRVAQDAPCIIDTNFTFKLLFHFLQDPPCTFLTSLIY